MGCGVGLLLLLLFDELLPVNVFMRRVRLRGRDREEGGDEGVYSWPRKEETVPCVGDFGGGVPQTFGAIQLCVEECLLSKAIPRFRYVCVCIGLSKETATCCLSWCRSRLVLVSREC